MKKMISKRLHIFILFIIYETIQPSESQGYFYDVPKIQFEIKSPHKRLIKEFEWKNLEFGFPNEAARKLAIENGDYRPEVPLPIDVDVFYSPRSDETKIFVTTPRFIKGAPYSVAYVTNMTKPNGVELQPYPSYDWHTTYNNSCDGLVSVYRIQIDRCGHMWILDSGEIAFQQYCPPKIVVIDLHTNQLIHRYALPEEMFKSGISRFVTPLIDIADPPPLGECLSAFVYMADVTGFGIVIYDVNKNQSWRIENKYTFPDPDFTKHTVNGKSFELTEGVLGLTVTPRKLNIERMLYFHAISNDLEIALPLSIANNGSIWKKITISNALNKFKVLGRRGTQCAASAMSEAGFLFCGYNTPIGIFAWNIRTPYTVENRILVAENPETLQFISGLKVIKNRQGKEELWTVSNRIQNFYTGTMNYTEINYRIQRCGVDELLQGKPCQI